VAGFRHADRHHVCVTDGLDLLAAIPARELVEGREDLVEDADDEIRIGLLGEWGEVGDVREQDRDRGVAIRDPARSALQSLRDRRREDVEQQRL
jgi:hypothetical protein